MRFRSLTLSALVAIAVVVPSTLLAQVQANFSVAHKTELPGGSLKPGNYKIQVLDHLSDRIIVRVDNSAGQEEALFLGVNAPTLPKTGSPVMWQSTGDTAALRGYAFTNGPSIEFVYPKADAVRLAKENNSSVVAIDPASEGRKPKHMSGEDMQLVSLWLLTPTRVGPDSQPGIAAKHFEATPEKGPVMASTSGDNSSGATAGTQLAQANTRPELINRRSSPKPAHAVKVLPHTASSMPLLWVVGACSLGGAVLLRRERLA